ncbi:RIP metalloprotease RseP [Undibacterium sp. Di24W]|uniref:RIP metalloprotease RseP n=1 Tax=Undibacterium sp. Di24W TaxID=3413033 RepID=UPI003BF48FE7
MIQTVLAFVFALGSLIIFHELGHFLVARWCGVRVLRFSIGMGKPIFVKKFGNSPTEWTISAIPLGGYVKMLDSREVPKSEMTDDDLREDFSGKSVWRRIAIVAAGPIANFLLAIVLFSVLFMVGIADPIAKIRVASQTSTAYQSGFRHGDHILRIDGEAVQSWSDMRWKLMQKGLNKQDAIIAFERPNRDRATSMDQLEIKLPTSQLSASDLEADFLNKMGIGLYRGLATIQEVSPNGLAAKAGLQAGDQILEIDDHKILDGRELVDIISASPGKTLTMLVSSAKQEFEVQITPDSVLENGKRIGRIQVPLASNMEMTTITYSGLDAIAKGAFKTWQTSVLTLKMIGNMLLGDVSWKNITGPLTIADYAGQTARIGLISYISFIALISISLGVMNLLPIPVLDGGHLLYYSLEVLTGRPIPDKYAEMAQRGGLAVLLCLMVVAFFNDIVRLMS